MISYGEVFEAAEFKVEVIQLISLFLNPLCHIQKIILNEREEIDVTSDFSASVFKGIDEIMKQLSKGFYYKGISVPIAEIFIKVMENYSEVVIRNDDDFLDIYLKMLCFEVRFNFSSFKRTEIILLSVFEIIY